MDHFVAAFFISKDPTRPIYITWGDDKDQCLENMRNHIDISEDDGDTLCGSGDITFSPNVGPESFVRMHMCGCNIPLVHKVYGKGY